MVISVSSRKAKGRRLQSWAAKAISKITKIPWGKDELIAPREMGQTGTDVRLIGEALKKFPFSVECKYQETWALPSWIKQAKENQKEGTCWLLICKKNFGDPIVVIDAEVFFEIYKRVLEQE